MSALGWCGLAVVLLVVALWIVGFALLMTRAALAQAQLEAEQKAKGSQDGKQN